MRWGRRSMQSDAADGELVKILGDSGSRVLICQVTCIHIVRAALSAIGVRHTITLALDYLEPGYRPGFLGRRCARGTTVWPTSGSR